MKKLFTLLLLALPLGMMAQPANMKPIHVEGNQLVDSEGNVKVLHGVMDTPSPYFNNNRWGWNCSSDNIAPCIEYFNKLFTAITDSTSGAYCNLFRLHLDPCWTNDPNKVSDGKESGEADISRFSETRLTTLMSTLYGKIARNAVGKGLYVIMRPPGVCPGSLKVGDYYQEYLIKVWDIVTKNKLIAKEEYAGYFSIELANEPVSVKNADGTETDNTLHDYFQPIVDKIRENGFKGIIWVPGSGWQSNYRGYAKVPITDPLNNFGYAVHDYPGWYSSSDENPNYKYVCAKFKESVPVVMTHPIVITEVDWSPEVEGKGHYNEHGDWVPGNMGTWATASTSKWGRGFRAMKDYFGNISMTLSGTACYIDIDSYINDGKVVPAFNAEAEACGQACFEWYEYYAKNAPVVQDGFKELMSPVDTLYVKPGETKQVTVNFVCNNGQMFDVALLCNNRSLNTTLLTIDGNYVTGVKEGKTELRFSLTDKNGTTRMLVVPVKVTNLVSGIDDAKREDKVHTIYRSIDGRRLSSPVKGLNIVETVNADGSKEIKKVLYK